MAFVGQNFLFPKDQLPLSPAIQLQDMKILTLLNPKTPSEPSRYLPEWSPLFHSYLQYKYSTSMPLPPTVRLRPQSSSLSISFPPTSDHRHIPSLHRLINATNLRPTVTEMNDLSPQLAREIHAGSLVIYYRPKRPSENQRTRDQITITAIRLVP